MIQIDHIGIAAHDALASARALAAILGAAEPVVDGPDSDMYRVDLAHGAFLLFNRSPTVSPGHVAFRVEHSRFVEVVVDRRTIRWVVLVGCISSMTMDTCSR